MPASDPTQEVLPGPRRRVLVTGANGTIGSDLAPHLAAAHDLVLGHRAGADTAHIAGHGVLQIVDLARPETLRAACAGVDTVVHLAAEASPDTEWEDVLTTNIVGTWHLVEAALAAGCRRLIYASSIHAVSGAPVGRQVRAEDPVSPGDLYGVSKCFGEALASWAATQRDLSAICIRIGAYQPVETARDPDSLPLMDAWISPRDFAQLVLRAIAVTDLDFAIVHGLSANRFNRLDLSGTTRLLGYQPEDDFTALNPLLAGLHLADRVQPHDEEASGDA